MKTIGVIGLGSIGMRHAKNLLAMGHRVLGYDPDDERSKALADLGGMQAADPIPYSFEVLGACDAVVVASPTHQHLAHLDRAVIQKKPVLVEKPITCAANPSYAREVVKAAKAPIMVGCNLRFHSCVKKAKEWLDAGLIGDPIWANFTCAQYNDRYTDSVILNWGAHEVDLAYYLLGDAKVTACSARRHNGKYDLADILLHHGSGCRTSVHVDYLTQPELRMFRICGTLGGMEVNLKTRTAIALGPDMKILGMKVHPTPDGSWDQDYIEEMQAFIDRIDGKEALGATGEDGLAVLELCLEAKRLAGI